MPLMFVMAGLNPAIHEKRPVDARIMSGHHDSGVVDSGDHNV